MPTNRLLLTNVPCEWARVRLIEVLATLPLTLPVLDDLGQDRAVDPFCMGDPVDPLFYTGSAYPDSE